MPQIPDFEKVYKDYARLYASKRAEECKEAIRHLYALASSKQFSLSQEQVEDLIVCTVELFLRADRDITQGEKDLLHFVFADSRLEERVFAAMTDDISPIEQDWDALIDALPKDAKDAVTTIGMCMIAADDKINLREKMLFEKIYL